MIDILSYGGGMQSVAMCVLAAQGKLPRPQHIVLADTGREISSTRLYLDTFLSPYLAEYGMRVEVASHELATVDLYAHNGDLLLPAHTATGQLRTFCSNEWKKYVLERYLRQEYGYKTKELLMWIGFSLDERRRIKGYEGRIYPLAALGLRRYDCVRIIQDAGLPEPSKSRCWCCPHQSPKQWQELSDAEKEQAIMLDQEISDANQRGSLFLHRSRKPLVDALDSNDGNEGEPTPCQSGMCFV